jgi:FKBP-type peptidyl-prolyl cis-trans isomerase FklB
MKMQWLAPMALVFVAPAVLLPVAHAEDPALSSDKDKSSYAVGVDMGRNLRNVGAEVQVEAMMRGLRDGLSGAKPALPDDQIRELMTAYRSDLQKKQEAAIERMKVVNHEKGDQFVAEYKKRGGVTVLPDGLVYRVLKAGTGTSPALSDTVAVNYSGHLVDGTHFDGSEPGKPTNFKLSDDVVKGWLEALQHMQAGSQWEVVMPPSLAYGERGFARGIPPGATLVFDIELVSFAPSEATASRGKGAPTRKQ